MKKTFLFAALAVAALTFGACDKTDEVVEEPGTEQGGGDDNGDENNGNETLDATFDIEYIGMDETGYKSYVKVTASDEDVYYVAGTIEVEEFGWTYEQADLTMEDYCLNLIDAYTGVEENPVDGLFKGSNDKLEVYYSGFNDAPAYAVVVAVNPETLTPYMNTFKQIDFTREADPDNNGGGNGRDETALTFEFEATNISSSDPIKFDYTITPSDENALYYYGFVSPYDAPEIDYDVISVYLANEDVEMSTWIKSGSFSGSAQPSNLYYEDEFFYFFVVPITIDEETNEATIAGEFTEANYKKFEYPEGGGNSGSAFEVSFSKRDDIGWLYLNITPAEGVGKYIAGATDAASFYSEDESWGHDGSWEHYYLGYLKDMIDLDDTHSKGPFEGPVTDQQIWTENVFEEGTFYYMVVALDEDGNPKWETLVEGAYDPED